MNVYHNGNLWSHSRHGRKLTPFFLQETVLWGDQELFLPAIYVGTEGVILDICAKIPVEKMAEFLKKWDQKRRLSLKTQEELEQFDAENPGSRDFIINMSLDDIPLVLRSSSSLMWYPPVLTSFQAASDNWSNDKTAEELMDAYNCARNSCWHLGRLSYDWNNEPIPHPEKISLHFEMHKVPVTAGYFTTNLSGSEQTVLIKHPITGQEYTLTLHHCEQTRQNFSEIGQKGILYPEYCHVLSYNISPEPENGAFFIRDCSDGDQPRKMAASDKKNGVDCLSTSVFMVGNHYGPDQAAISSLHFEPFDEVRWRAGFQIKTREDMQIAFSVS